MSVKISELPILSSLADNDVIAGVDTSANVTSKIEMATLKNYIDTNTQYTAGTNIDITNNVISAPFVYDKTQTNALLDDFKDETNASIEDLKDEKDEQIEELQSEVDSLSTIYNAFPTESGEGESLTLDDTAEVKFKKFDLKGNTSQTTYSGKNIIKNTGVNQTINGITYVVNNDGSVKVSGTASARSEFYLYNNDTITLPINSGISYKNTTNAMVILKTNDGYKVFQANDTTSSGSATQIYQAYLRIENGTTVNETLYPMISEQGGSYEPYTGGQASPNPSYPQPVNVVSGDNEINVCGKNLFDKNNTNIFNGFTNTANNKLEANNNARTICFPCQSSTTYTISKTLSARFIVCETSSATISANIPTTTIEANPQAVSITGTTKSDAKYLLIFYYLSTADTLTENQIRDSIQIEKSSSASEYEPYQGNTYNIDLPVENEFALPSANTTNGITYSINDDNTINLSGTATADASFILYKDLADSNITNGDIYTFFVNKSLPSGVEISLEAYSDHWLRHILGSWLSSTTQKITNSANLTNATRVRYRINIINGTSVNISNLGIQLEKGSKQNNFTPYGTTPIELCKIGNYQDYFYKDSGKWYKYGAIGKVVFTGASGENWVFQSGSVWKYRIGINNSLLSTSDTQPPMVLSNYYKAGIWNNSANFQMGSLPSISTTLAIRNDDITSLADWKTWLSTHNTVVYYPLETPTNTEITYQPLIDQLNAIEKAMSKDGQTNISQVSNDRPFILDVTAIKSLQSVLDRIELLES